MLGLTALSGIAQSVRAQTNLPLGLNAEHNIPVSLDGFRLVALDRTKEVVFQVDGKKLTVEVPIFVYLPEGDQGAELRKGLHAIHADLARMSAERENIDPQRLMTIVLALDRLMRKEPPLATKPPAPDPLAPRPVLTPEPVEPKQKLQAAIQKNSGD